MGPGAEQAGQEQGMKAEASFVFLGGLVLLLAPGRATTFFFSIEEL